MSQQSPSMGRRAGAAQGDRTPVLAPSAPPAQPSDGLSPRLCPAPPVLLPVTPNMYFSIFLPIDFQSGAENKTIPAQPARLVLPLAQKVIAGMDGRSRTHRRRLVLPRGYTSEDPALCALSSFQLKQKYSVITHRRVFISFPFFILFYFFFK